MLGQRCVFVTAYEGKEQGKKGWTLCIDRQSGKELWRTEGFTLQKKFGSVNTPVSATPVTDGSNVYVFFESAGLISYDEQGKERWRRELGTFNNPYGMANSPMLVGSTLILQVDQDLDSYLLAVNAKDGAILWKTKRPEANHGYSTPVLYQPKGQPAQLIVSGSYQVCGFSVKTGEKLWWVEGMAWQAKSTPVVDGDMLYVHSWMADLGELVKLPPGKSWAQLLEEYDTDKDGKIAPKEAPDKEMARIWFLFDLDRSGFIEQKDYDIIQSRNSAQSGLFAIALGGNGNITAKAVQWKATKQLPNIPSPLLYRNVLYVLKEGGILTAYDPKSGKVLKEGPRRGRTGRLLRLPGRRRRQDLPRRQHRQVRRLGSRSRVEGHHRQRPRRRDLGHPGHRRRPALHSDPAGAVLLRPALTPAVRACVFAASLSLWTPNALRRSSTSPTSLRASPGSKDSAGKKAGTGAIRRISVESVPALAKSSCPRILRAVEAGARSR